MRYLRIKALFFCGLVTIQLFGKNNLSEPNSLNLPSSGYEYVQYSSAKIDDHSLTKEEFHFGDGSVGYFVSRDGERYGVANSDGKMIVPMIFKKVTCHGNLLYCREPLIKGEELSSCSLYNKKGKCKIDGYKSLDFTEKNGRLYVTSDTPMAVFDENGDCLYKYKECHDSKGFVYLKNELTDTIVVRPGKYTGYFHLMDDVIKMQVGSKKGVMEWDGTVVIPAEKYCSIYGTKNGFIVELSQFGEGIVGYYDRKGRCIFPAEKYTDIYPLDNGMFEVRFEGKASVADSLGNVILSTGYRSIKAVRDDEGKWYYKTFLGNDSGKMSLTGEVISEPHPTRNQRNVVKDGFSYSEVCDENGLYGIVDASGKQIIPCHYSMIIYDKSIPGFKLFKNGYVGIADLNGKVVIPCTKYHGVMQSYRSDKKFPKCYEVDYKGKIGLCDTSGNELIKPQFDDVMLNSTTTVKAKLGLMKGVVDLSGNVVIPLEYTDIYHQNDGTYEVKLFKKSGLCDSHGRVIIPAKYDDISKYRLTDGGEYSHIFMVKDGDTEGLYSTRGEEIFPAGLFKTVGLGKGNNLSLTAIGQQRERFRMNIDFFNSNLIDTKLNADLFVYAYNDYGAGEFYYDLKGHLMYDSSKDKDFDRYFDKGSEEFSKKNYKKSIEYYRQAIAVKADGVAYYNIGAAYYNMDKYADAINSLKKCISLNPRQSIIDDANDLIVDCEYMMQRKNERRAQAVIGVLGSVLNVASSIMQTNAAINSYNNNLSNGSISSYNVNGYSDDTSSRTEVNVTRQANKCGVCNGTGRIEDSTANFGLSGKKWCSECQEYRMNGHYHKNCPYCHGKGYR